MNIYVIISLCAACFVGLIYVFLRWIKNKGGGQKKRSGDDGLKDEEKPSYWDSPLLKKNIPEKRHVEIIDPVTITPQHFDTAKLVKCTVFAPSSAKAGTAVMVQLFIHIAAHQQMVRLLAMEVDDQAKLRGSRQLNGPIEHGTRLTFYFSMPGVEVDEPTQHLIWTGFPESLQFALVIGSDHQAGDAIGTIYVTENSVPCGHIKFTLKIEDKSTAENITPAKKESSNSWKRYKYAYIAYASADRPEVLKRVQMLPRLGIQYFQDLISLEPGDRWENALYQHIEKSDVFFLFWSSAAKNSSWVMKEIRYALNKQKQTPAGSPEIIPIIIEGPPVAAPPPELSDIHFNDPFIHFLNLK